MMDLFIRFLYGCWDVLLQMSPYLLFGFIVAGVLSLIFSAELIESQLGEKGLKTVVKAALIGVPLPLCSCSVIPVTASLKRHGASKGAITSFLSSTPQTGVDSILVTYGMLGPVLTIFKVVTAFISGLVSGTLVNFLKSDKSEDVTPQEEGEAKTCCHSTIESASKRENPIERVFRYAFITIPEDISGSMLLGIILAGLIYAFIPPDFFTPYMGSGVGAMLIMLLISVPLYVCATSSVPLASALLLKGVSPGAILVFLIAGPATNIATVATIFKVIGRKAALLYVFSIVVVALLSGLILESGFMALEIAAEHAHEMRLPLTLEVGTAIFMLILLVLNYVNSIWPQRKGNGVDSCH